MARTKKRSAFHVVVSVLACCLTLACASEANDTTPAVSAAERVVPEVQQSSAVAIAVISLDPQGWNDVRAFLNDLPSPSAISIFYGNGNVLSGDHQRAIALLDSLATTQLLRPSDTPATLPFFSTALSSAIASSLQSPAEHVRTVILGTFPPLAIRSASELRRIGPIITRTELDALTAMPDHQFVVIGPSKESVLRTMLLRAFSEAKSSVVSISYSSGVTR